MQVVHAFPEAVVVVHRIKCLAHAAGVQGPLVLPQMGVAVESPMKGTKEPLGMGKDCGG